MFASVKTYLSAFALRIFNEQKIALRKGNTYVLGWGENDWRVYKKMGDTAYHIHLKKKKS